MANNAVTAQTERTSANDAVQYRKPTQARGIAKFETILDAAHTLIETRGIDDFSLYDVAEEAGVATGSVYHFFPSLETAFTALVERYDLKFAEIASQPIDPDTVNSWEDILVVHTERSRAFINAHPPALTLIIGPGRTWATRQVDTIGDTHIARAMVASYQEYFKLPETPKPEVILHYAIRMLESLWELSNQQFGYVTDETSEETNRAMIAYLSLYWPRYLPVVEPTHPDA